MSLDCDLVVVGAGIHGAGVAQAAAAAGYSVTVLEARAPAAGTSSRSSKLVHGGLRYLESGQFRLVHESLRERHILLGIAPHLVRLVPFHIPLYAHSRRRPWQVRAGLSLYALLGGLRRENLFSAVPRAHWERLDGLRCEGLRAVFRYHDAQTDDAALTRAVLASAESLGARLLCPAELVAARADAQAVTAEFAGAAGSGRLRCRALVNAAGPWANAVQARIAPGVPGPAVELVQGAHLVLDRPAPSAVYYVEAADGRAVFVMPWRGCTLVGTTETPFHGDPGNVEPLARELDYLEAVHDAHFPSAGGRRLSAFAGLRVLPAGGREVFHRRRETLFHQDPRVPRVLGLYGGKLTTYRATAARALARLRRWLPPPRPVADTATLRLPPAGDGGPVPDTGVTPTGPGAGPRARRSGAGPGRDRARE